MKGFTLLEMLVALAVFAMIAAVTYAAIVPAGEGFQALRKVRDSLEHGYQLDRRLRMDVDYLSLSADKNMQPLEIAHDQRGGDSYDQLWLLVADVSSPALIRVHYFLDEDQGVLVRESSIAWQRSGEQPVRWDMGKAVSFKVQAMDVNRQWHDLWDAQKSSQLPRALRILWRDEHRERELILPIFLDEASPT